MWIINCTIFYFAFNFIGFLFVVIGLLHLIEFIFCCFDKKFEVKDGKVRFKKFNFRYSPVKWISIKSVIKIEQGTRKIGGIWKMLSVPTFFFYTENGEKYEIFPATDKQNEIEKYTNIISKNFDLEVVKSI